MLPPKLAAELLTDPHRAAAALRSGQLVALPTETVYGLGGNALDSEAVAGIFAAKNRPSFDPLIIHQSTAARILAYAEEAPEYALRLAEAFWPGPLTLVLPKTKVVPDLVSAGLPTVALRVPDHPLTRRVLDALDFPVAAPSANPFGFVSPTSAQHVLDQLGDRIDFVLDGGSCRVGLESTIVAFPSGHPTLLRKGGIGLEAITEVLGMTPAVRTHSSSRPDAPGMLSRHYSPGTPLEIRDTIHPGDGLLPSSAVLLFGSGADRRAELRGEGIAVFDLSRKGDLTEAARNLFAVLRVLAAGDFSHAYAERLPETGLGRAINDRLQRAAATED